MNKTDASLRSQHRLEAARLLAGFAPADITAWDQAESLPAAIPGLLAEAGLLGTFISTEHGGRGWDAVSFGLLCAEFGQSSLSLLSIVTVHSMVMEAIRLSGTDQQRAEWLPALAKGKKIGAFALTEPDFGSEATGIQTTLVACDEGYRVSGRKKWISYAARADVLLVFGKLQDGGPEDNSAVACLLPTDTPGLRITPMKGLLGFRAAMLGEIEMTDCVIPAANLIGRKGAGINYVAAGALDLGRLAIAFGSLGAMEACVTDSVNYAKQRKQFGQSLSRHQLIQQMLADMITSYKAAERLCLHAAELRAAGDPMAAVETATAKYFASTHAVSVANQAVQIHGAAGCSAGESRTERFYRDLKITEIIEGSNQMQQIMIAQNGMGEFVQSALRRKRLMTGD
ncbi:MAG: acyl-CoA dehydrogenase family protein [Pseudohongiella sp.]|nr:acyl-CoA dehydrogenase family protein [Pseudohongiella sp.]MDO9520169.1 acyl-CoA dehydrogenase family protein [Pseudohongiella sp.]MDP2125958.1 acyl-CoA dehydrogenase family protein [Pseudohongiella sp.]